MPGQAHNSRNNFSIFFNTMVCCVFSLESPHRGDFNKCTQHVIINKNRKSHYIIPNIIVSAPWDFFSRGLKNMFETAAVNELSVFEPLKFYCSYI